MKGNMASNPEAPVIQADAFDYTSKTNEITRLIRKLMQIENIYSMNLFRKYKVSVPQMNCLLTLYENGSMQPTQIARNVAVHSSTITGIVDRLESKEMVFRFRNLQDRRRIGIGLTDKGRRFVENGLLPLQMHLVNEIKNFTLSEIEQIIQALYRLAGIVEAQEIILKNPP